MHDSLNEAQRAAVFHKDGALLILAGAGAGKTRVIVHRIAELVRSGVSPERILAVTFTNKAAGEMRERVATLLGSDLSLSPYDTPKSFPFVGTFHALSLHIIKTFHTEAGLPSRFSIFDRSDSVRAVKKATEEAGFDPKELEPRRVLSIMSRAKSDGLTPDGFRAERSASYVDEAVAEVWERYAAILRKQKALDFDDILLTALALLSKEGPAQEFFSRAWDYVHVDEYQDTNRVQYDLVRRLSAHNGNIAVVGDADQNIYSWRGASLSHILSFEEDFANPAVVTLTENYRSTATIIQAANDAIAKNRRRREKTLFTRNPAGERINVSAHQSEEDEAFFVAREAARLIRQGRPPEDIAVLYRANFQSRVLEEAFLHTGIAYQVLGTRFFERAEIKDALSYLRLALNSDSETDLVRIMNTPTRGIGKTTLAKVAMGKTNELSSAQRGKVDAFFALMQKISDAVKRECTSESVRATLALSGMKDYYERGKGEDEERLGNLKELVSLAAKYDHLPPGEGVDKLLEEAALQSDQDELSKREDRRGVKLMTVHASKGLEFPVVFVTGLEEGLFPQERSGKGDDDPEEERRLFYVALTRAGEKAYLSFAASRRIFGSRSFTVPSTFVSEMDPSLIEAVGLTGSIDTDDIDTIV